MKKTKYCFCPYCEYKFELYKDNCEICNYDLKKFFSDKDKIYDRYLYLCREIFTTEERVYERFYILKELVKLKHPDGTFEYAINYLKGIFRNSNMDCEEFGEVGIIRAYELGSEIAKKWIVTNRMNTQIGIFYKNTIFPDSLKETFINKISDYMNSESALNNLFHNYDIAKEVKTLYVLLKKTGLETLLDRNIFEFAEEIIGHKLNYNKIMEQQIIDWQNEQMHKTNAIYFSGGKIVVEHKNEKTIDDQTGDPYSNFDYFDYSNSVIEKNNPLPHNFEKAIEYGDTSVDLGYREDMVVKKLNRK